MTEEEADELTRKAEIAEKAAQAQARLAAVQPAWRIKEQQAQKDYYARMNQAHEQAMQRKREFIESNPGSYSPWEKQAVDKYFKDKASEEQRIADNEFRNEQLTSNERIAEHQKDGQIGNLHLSIGYAKYNDIIETIPEFIDIADEMVDPNDLKD